MSQKVIPQPQAKSEPLRPVRWLLLAAAALAGIGVLINVLRRRSVDQSHTAQQPETPQPEITEAASTSVVAATVTQPQHSAVSVQIRWTFFVSLGLTLLVLSLLLPRPYSLIVFWTAVFGCVTIVAVPKLNDLRRNGFGGIATESPIIDLPQVSGVSLPRTVVTAIMVVELGVLVGASLWATQAFVNGSNERKMPGIEGEWITSATYFASVSLEDHGFIPLWIPYLEYGEPMHNNPVSFTLNPFSAFPSYILGGRRGIQISVVIYAVLAAWGGWALGKTLGLGPLGRVLLGLLMLGKGNMHANLGSGYFQLGTSQAMLPWVTAGAVGVMTQRDKRYPVVMLALAFSLLYTAGNVWYVLPAAIFAGGVALAFTGWRGVNLWGWRRMVLAGVLTVMLTAVTLIPLWINREYMGAHPNEQGAGWVVDRVDALRQFVDGSYSDPPAPAGRGGAEQHFYYSYVTPLWFLVVLFVLLPPVPPLHRNATRWSWRVWVLGVLMIVFFTMWGVGGTGLFLWLYENVPLLPQWRFVGRALGGASFWIAVLVAMRVDGLWRLLVQPLENNTNIAAYTIRALLAVTLTGASLFAATDVVRQWRIFTGTLPLNPNEAACLDWLREQRPNEQIDLYMHGYEHTDAFFDNRIRLVNIEADIEASPRENTLTWTDMRRTPAPYAMALFGRHRITAESLGYAVWEESPNIFDGPCLFQQTNDTLSYAFTIPLDDIENATEIPPSSITTPVTDLYRLPDHIAMEVEANPNETIVLTVKEGAYPGWHVWVNGRRQNVESVGGFIGVKLEPTTGSYTVHFRYLPILLYVGGVITIGGAVFCILFLLHGERWLFRRRETITANDAG